MSRSNQPSSSTLGKKTASRTPKKPISPKKQGIGRAQPVKKSAPVTGAAPVAQTPAVQRRKVTEDEAGQRLDNYLLRHLKGVPKSRIYRIVRSGEVRINGGRCQPDQRLNIGDELRLPPVRQEAFIEDRPPVAPEVNLPVLYEDDSLLAINKPCGIAVHGGSGLAWGAIEALRAQRPEARLLELAHRLDRETSGVLLIAKRRPALVLSSPAFNDTHDQLVLGMITTASQSAWDSDVPLQQWSKAGLSTACLFRLKLFTLDQSLILKTVGKLAAVDRKKIQASLQQHLAI